MRPPAVVVSLDELDDGVLGGVAGWEAPAVVHLVLQRGEERLGHGVIVAVAGAAAGKTHVAGPRPLGQRPTGVLGPYCCGIWRFPPRSRANWPTRAPPP